MLMTMMVFLGLVGADSAGQAATASAPLAGTSWQLVRFQGGDDSVLTPDDPTKYTLTFGADGAVAVRLDCNRGRGTWKSSGDSQLELGPLALTRAMCKAPAMHDHIARQWTNIRSYIIRDGRLFLSLMADGGIYEFQPTAPPAGAAGEPALKSPVESRGPTTWTCAPAAGGGETLRVTLYRTRPAMVLLERGGEARPAFQIRSASGARYQGDGVSFWEVRGEATLTWMGDKATCKPQ